MDWIELFSSSQYDLPFEIEVGSTFEGGVGFPDGVITASELLYPRRILVQRIEMNAEDASRDRRERIRIYRVAVETEDGDLVEVKRLAVPCDEAVDVDTSKCNGCGGKIPEGQHVIIDSLAYHKRCVEDDDDRDVTSISSDASGPGDNHTLPERHDSEAAQENRTGVSSSIVPASVIKSYKDDGVCSSHFVMVTVADSDSEIVTLWAKEHGSLSGTVQGRWSGGLFHGELPKRTDVSYIDEKFFNGAGVVNSRNLRVWNSLYNEAMQELYQPPR